MHLYSNALRILPRIVAKLASIGSMLSHYRGCISTSIDDLALLQHWSSFCVLIGYTKFYTKSYLLAFTAHTPNCLRLGLRLLICVSASWTNEALLRDSHGTLGEGPEGVLGGLLGELLGGLLGGLDGGFSRIACMFHWRIGSMAKGTCYGHMRRPNTHLKDAYSR